MSNKTFFFQIFNQKIQQKENMWVKNVNSIQSIIYLV